MGVVYSAYISSPDTTPNFREDPTFDPLYGFENGRKERKMKVTEEQLEAAGIMPEERDYCAHFLVDFYKCRRQKFPWVAGCKPEKHAWEQCQHEDWVLRMKEFERERRLLERTKKKKQLEGHSEVLGD